MSIVLIGVNHRTAPVELREQLSLSGCGLDMALEDLAQKIQSDAGSNGSNPRRLYEATILSTCNRLEVYAIVKEASVGWRVIEDFLSQLQGITPGVLRPHLYFMEGQAAVEHLLRVAAGLDSMILGEPQILGQVSAAYAAAQKAGVTGPLLSHLFPQAIHAGKRARTETAISRYTTSVSHVAAILAEGTIGPLADKTILVVGTGEMAEQAVDALEARGAQMLLCINRTFARAEELAQKIGGKAYNWYHLPEALKRADMVISATGAPHTIIYVNDVTKILPGRNGRPLLFVDVAVPRDIEEAVGELPGVILHDIDDLQNVLDENMAHRQAAVPDVEAILAEETTGFIDWLHGREVVPVIKDLRQRGAEIASAELEWALNKVDSPETKQLMDQLAHRIVNKLMHEPTLFLKAQAAAGNGYGYAHAVRELFALDADEHTPEKQRESRLTSI